MSGRRAAFLLVGWVIAWSCLHPAAQVPAEPGVQWLSWTAIQKNAYVGGFIDGYLNGTSELCGAAGDFSTGGNMSSGGDQRQANSSASAACFVTRGDYSKQYSSKTRPDFSVYADIITEFYTKYPRYHGVSFRRLMLSLRDGICNSADQLYQKALQGDLR